MAYCGYRTLGRLGIILEYVIMPLSLIVWLVEAIREAVSHLLVLSTWQRS